MHTRKVATTTRDGHSATTHVFHMTEAEYYELDDDSIGLCYACGATVEMCEPDAARYHCDECHSNRAYGAANALLMHHIVLEADVADAESDP